jgi:hypothetical protein
VEPAVISRIKGRNVFKAMNSRSKKIRELYRRVNKFKRGYQPRNNLVKVETDYLLVDSHNILSRWKNFSY